MSFNKIILVGNLGKDPELRYTPQQTAVCSFSLATNERKKDKSGEWQDVTTWFKVTLWGKQAETAAKYLSKGRPVYIEGRLQVEEWTDRDNNNRYSLAVNATDMHFISAGRDEASGGSGYSAGGSDDYEPQYTGGGGSGGSASAGTAPAPRTVAPVAPDDDIPF
jgi:single-strand DNA-binding protein